MVSAALRTLTNLFAWRLREQSVREILLAVPGVAGVEDVRITRRVGHRPSVSAFIHVSADVLDQYDVVRVAARHLRRQLPVSEVLLVNSGVPRRGILIVDAKR